MIVDEGLGILWIQETRSYDASDTRPQFSLWNRDVEATAPILLFRPLQYGTTSSLAKLSNRIDIQEATGLV